MFLPDLISFSPIILLVVIKYGIILFSLSFTLSFTLSLYLSLSEKILQKNPVPTIFPSFFILHIELFI